MGSQLAAVSWLDANQKQQGRCYLQRSDGMLIEAKLGDDYIFHATSTFEPIQINPGGHVASLHSRVQDPTTGDWGDTVSYLPFGFRLDFLETLRQRNWDLLFLVTDRGKTNTKSTLTDLYLL